MKCFKCGLDSDELVWKTLESSPKPVMWHEGQQRPHNCKPKPIKTEKMVFCRYCDPLKREKMPASKLQEHIKTAHLEFFQ